MFNSFTEIRKKIFKTQKEMAAAFNISTQMISNLENNKNKPSYEMLSILLNDYNVNLNYLIAGKGDPLLCNNDNINKDNEITQLKDKINQLEIENKLLKELIKK